MGSKGETLSDSALSQLKPIAGEGGRTWRAYCPFHGSDKQRSLRVNRQSGRFQCFACEAWGYMDWARERFTEQKGYSTGRSSPRPVALRPASAHPVRVSSPPKATGTSLPLTEILLSYQAALPGSLAEDYLAERGIPLVLAQQLGLGYSAPGQWAHRTDAGKPIRDWKFGRVVFPHTAPGGQLVNLYGRAVGDYAPKTLRHDHLPGAKGYFNFPALETGPREEVYVCEGPFDALSLLTLNPNLAVVAIFGVQGWRHDWASNCRNITFALDSDAAGQAAWRSLARQLTLRGKKVRSLSPADFGGAKDLNEALVSGTLSLSGVSFRKSC